MLNHPPTAEREKTPLKTSRFSNKNVNAVVLSGLHQHIIAQNFVNKPVVAIQDGKDYSSVMLFLLC